MFNDALLTSYNGNRALLSVLTLFGRMILPAQPAHSKEIPNSTSLLRMPQCTRLSALPATTADISINCFLKVTKKTYHVKAISRDPRLTPALARDIHILGQRCSGFVAVELRPHPRRSIKDANDEGDHEVSVSDCWRRHTE